MEITKSFLAEFGHEVENTRRLLNAVPDTILDYRPNNNEKLWNIAELASHIARIYHWVEPVVKTNATEFTELPYEAGDISSMKKIIAKFEENVQGAQKALEELKEEQLADNWKMTIGGQEIVSFMKVQAIRGFVFNHLYHHRGELVALLRVTGNKVPGLYRPTSEEMNL